MSAITTKDGTTIFYKDWGTGQPIVFHHGWPLSADDWDAQMLFFLHHGYRVIAHDRRGHGRSSQGSVGHDMDHYAADAAAVAEALDLRDAIHIGHSTGGGEVARLCRPPWPRGGSPRQCWFQRGSANHAPDRRKMPGGLPIAVFDGLRAGLAANRAQFYRDDRRPAPSTGLTVPAPRRWTPG